MTIRARAGRFQVSVCHQGNRIQRQAPTLAHAEQMQIGMLEELKAMQPAATKAASWTLQDAFTRTWERCWRDSKNAAITHLVAKQVLNHFGRSTPLADITSDDIDAWVESLKKDGNANGTVNRKLSHLSKMLTTAIERGALINKPHMHRESEPEGRIRWLTDAEEARLLATFRHWSKDDHADAVEVLTDTGMRTGELWRVEARDVMGGMLSIWENKAAHPRSVPMTSRVAATLQRRAASRAGGKLFPFDNAWLRHQWERAQKLMGLENDPQFTPHALRHTCASRLVQRGFPIAKVQKWLGHKTITTTLRYAHLAPEDLISGIELLEQGRSGANIPAPMASVTSHVTMR